MFGSTSTRNRVNDYIKHCARRDARRREATQPDAMRREATRGEKTRRDATSRDVRSLLALGPRARGRGASAPGAPMKSRRSPKLDPVADPDDSEASLYIYIYTHNGNNNNDNNNDYCYYYYYCYYCYYCYYYYYYYYYCTALGGFWRLTPPLRASPSFQLAWEVE